MAHVEVNGIAIPPLADSFRERPEHIGSVLERGMNGGLNETRAGRKRAWTFRTFYQTPTMGEAMRRLIEGDHQVLPLTTAWSSLAASYKGSTPKSGGSYSLTASYTEIASGSFVEWAMKYRVGDFSQAGWDPTKGWTLAYRDVSFNQHFIATGAVAVARGAAANPGGVTQYNNGVAGSHGLGEQIDLASDGDVGIHGYSRSTGSGLAVRAREALFFPFALPDASWATAIYTRANAGSFASYPAAPVVELSGDCVEDDSVNVIGRVVELGQGNVVFAGTHYNNARLLEVDLVEV